MRVGKDFRGHGLFRGHLVCLEVIWFASCLIMIVGWIFQSTYSAHPQRQVATIFCTDASRIPIELVLFRLHPLPPPQARPGQAKSTSLLPGPTVMASKMASLLQILPPAFSPFFIQLSESSFKKSNQRPDSMCPFCLRTLNGFPFSVTWWDRL